MHPFRPNNSLSNKLSGRLGQLTATKGLVEERFEQKYGFFRPIVGEVVQNYLTWVVTWKNGFARVRCGIAARNICLPLAAKAGGFAHHAMRKRLPSSESS